MRRKEIVIVAMLMFALVIVGCGEKNESDVTIIGDADGPTSVFLASKNDKNSYTQIDQETAKLMMDIEDGHVIVDVRRQDEFDEGHITIIGIPFGKQFFKIARVALLPFGAKVVRVHY